jgi:hypothetical protein
MGIKLFDTERSGILHADGIAINLAILKFYLNNMNSI